MAPSASKLYFSIFNVAKEMLIYKLKKRLSRIKRRWWIRGWLTRRHLGAMKLISELADEDPESYKNYFRMSEHNFIFLLRRVSNKISKQDTICREALPAKLKLQITLRFLASGNSFKSLSYEFRVPSCSISKFVPEILDAVYEELKNFIEVSTNIFIFYLLSSYNQQLRVFKN